MTTFIMKPAMLTDWKIIRETKGCYVCSKNLKYGFSKLYIPKKNILKKID